MTSLAAALAACGGGLGGDNQRSNSGDTEPPGGASTQSLSGMAIDGPVSGAEVRVFDATGEPLQQTTTDATGAFRAEVSPDTAYPLFVTAREGENTVTDTPSDIDLAGIVTSAEQRSVALSPFSTLLVRRAQCAAELDERNPRSARNALTDPSAAQQLAGLSFGLAPEVRNQLLSARPETPAAAASLLLASESFAEALRRTARALTDTEHARSPDAVLSALACDLADETLNGTEAGAAAPVASTFRVAASEVALESAVGRLQVGDTEAIEALDTALAQSFDQPAIGVTDHPVGPALLGELRRNVYAALRARPSEALIALFEQLQTLTPTMPRSEIAATLGASPQAPLAPVRAALKDAEAITHQALLDAAGRDADSPAAAPNIETFAATPAQLDTRGRERVTLEWTTSAAAVCTRSGSRTDGWAGTGDASGQLEVGPIEHNETFTLRCVGPGGTTTARTQVVVPPKVRVALPEFAELGEEVTVDFDSDDANACTVTVTGAEESTEVETGDAVQAEIGTGISVECEGPGGTVVASEGLAIRAARLSWDAPTKNVDGTPVDDLASFRVYHGSEPGSRDSVIEVADPEARQLTRAFPSGPRYFSMTAIDEDGNESGFSEEISKVIP